MALQEKQITSPSYLLINCRVQSTVIHTDKLNKVGTQVQDREQPIISSFMDKVNLLCLPVQVLNIPPRPVIPVKQVVLVD